MVDMEIRTELKPIAGPKRAKLPLGSWNLKKDEKKIVCNSFFGMKAPVRFCSNIRNLVSMKELALVGLKSHDCHIIMQHLLPIAIRSVFEKPVRYAIIRFCLFFKAICAKVIDVSALKKMQADLVETVCLLEKYFPPSFFDIMIHLTVHLVREVEFCGPVFFRWMYPFERYMKVLKGYVKSRKHPEGCIAKKYILEEAVEFCADRMLPDEASGTVIVYYISHLHKLLKQSKMVEMFGFVDPSHVARLAAGNMKQRAAKLCDRYRQGSAGQIWLIPYNPGDHWVLTIVKLDDESVFYMDPIRKPCQDVEWMTIVENSIKLYKNQTTDKLKWKNLAGIPKQFIGNGCAYFVMFFMKSIINDNSLDFRTKWEYRGKAGNLKCTQKDIDQVIGEWAGHVLGFGDGHPVHT